LETIAVDVEVLKLWQQAIPKFGERMLVDPTLAELSFRKLAWFNALNASIRNETFTRSVG
jgi:hypothetical protein